MYIHILYKKLVLISSFLDTLLVLKSIGYTQKASAISLKAGTAFEQVFSLSKKVDITQFESKGQGQGVNSKKPDKQY